VVSVFVLWLDRGNYLRDNNAAEIIYEITQCNPWLAMGVWIGIQITRTIYSLDYGHL
jgi:hypothetical protein